MVVYTGGSASIRYGYEDATTFGTAAIDSDLTNIFGLQQKVSGLTLSNTRIDLNKMGQVEPTKFAYGQQAGTCSVGFIIDNGDSHKIFRSLYGSPAGNGTSSTPYKYPANLGQGEVSPTISSLTTRIQLLTSANTLTRTLKGCIVNSLGLSTSIGETLNATIDMSFGKEDTAVVAAATNTFVKQTSSSPDVDQGATPFTFAHGELKVSNGTAAVAVAEVQDVDVTFTQNSELLYGLNSNSAIDAYRKVFDISGKFRTAWKDSSLIQYVIDQVRTGKELLDTSGVGMELIFTNGTKSLKLELDDLSIGDHSVSGLEPVEPVFEEINWKIKSSRISVVNG